MKGFPLELQGFAFRFEMEIDNIIIVHSNSVAKGENHLKML